MTGTWREGLLSGLVARGGAAHDPATCKPHSGFQGLCAACQKGRWEAALQLEDLGPPEYVLLLAGEWGLRSMGALLESSAPQKPTVDSLIRTLTGLGADPAVVGAQLALRAGAAGEPDLLARLQRGEEVPGALPLRARSVRSGPSAPAVPDLTALRNRLLRAQAILREAADEESAPPELRALLKGAEDTTRSAAEQLSLRAAMHKERENSR